MRKRCIIIIGIIYSFLVTTIVFNVYIKLEYNISIKEYFEKVSPITKKEKQWLVENAPLVFGSDQTSPPLRYEDINDNQYKGIVVDIINSLSIIIGQKIDFQKHAWWKDSLDGLSNHYIDFFDLIKSEERSQDYLFTDPLYSLNGNILKAKKNTSINRYQDLKGKKVAIIEGDYSIEFLKSKVEDVDIELTPDVKTAIIYLLDKKVDAVVGDEPVLNHYIKELNIDKEYAILKEPIYIQKASLAVPKGQETLVKILNKAIFRLEKSGVYGSIIDKWKYECNDINAIIYQNPQPKAVYILLVTMLISIYIFYGSTYILSKEIQKKSEELKKVEIQLVRDSKMAAIGQLASGVAHEIRNPLGIIRNYCYLLKDDVTQDEKVEYIKEIETNVDRASNIVSNLLNFGKLTGDLIYEVNLKEFINILIDREKSSILNKNINVVVNCSNMALCINVEVFNHIITNLLSNAVDAVEHNGDIIIDCLIKDEYLNIDMKDNGVGIKTDDITNIFNPFFTTKPVGEGTGLGLYIVYNLVSKQNGEINVESNENIGTCFHVKLPINRERVKYYEDINC